MFCYAVLVAGLSIAVGLPIEKGQDEPVPGAQNISLLLNELKNLRNEVDYHLHGGLTLYPHDLDQTLREVKQMTHEYHVHYVHHPHEGHYHQHNETSLRHVEEFHLLAGASRKLQSARQENKNQDHASPRVKDIHDYHGLDLTVDDFGQIDADLFEPDHYTFRSGDDPHVHRETWEVAYCNLKPNVELPESKVKGEIYISQRIDRSPTLFYDMDVTGFDLTGGRIYGFHVHEFPVVEGKCSTAGGYLNAGPDTKFYPHEHHGYIGDFVLNHKGVLNHVIYASQDEDFHGKKNILGYSIVVHGLGLGDNSSSLHLGRLACCNIVLINERNTATTPNE